MKTFVFKATHDQGIIKLRATATNEEQAVKIICNAENCPPAALKLIKVINL